MGRSRVIALDNFQQFTAINVLTDPGHIGGPVVIPNGVKVLLTWILGDGKIGHNVLGGSVTGSFSPTPAIAEAIRTALTSGASWTALAAHLAPTASLGGVLLQDIRNPFLPLISSTGGSTPGTSTGTELPNEVALVATFRTALTGRANRGRMFVPGWATTALGTANLVATAALTAYSNWAGSIPGVLNTQGITMAVLHPARAAYTGSTGTAHPARPAGLVPVTQVVVRDNHWDSMRRRGLK